MIEAILAALVEALFESPLPPHGQTFREWWRKKSWLGRIRVIVSWMLWLLLLVVVAAIAIVASVQFGSWLFAGSR